MNPDELWNGFCDPPDEARPRAWWHWMDGNVDPEGIRLDLEWLHSVGVRGVHAFDGGMGTPLVVPEPVRQGSPAWRDAVRLAAVTAHRLGMEFTVASSAGWSAAGGPWVQPADAMKKLVWSRTPIEGGRRVEQRLAPLPDVAGPYQDLPGWGTDPDRHRFAQDWAVVAVRAERIPEALVPAEVTASSPVGDWSCLVDGGFGGALSLPRDVGAASTAWVEQRFDRPVTVVSATVGLPGPRGFGASPPADAVLEAWDDDGAGGWRALAHIAVLEQPAGAAVPVRTTTFPPVTARRFRLLLTGGPAAAGVPRLAEGVRPLPVFHPATEFLLSEFALFPAARVHEAELKAGFAAAPDYFALDTDPAAVGAAVDPGEVVDLTGRLDDDGLLRWDAPPGEWAVLRFGASLTGRTNGPAPAEVTGLEVDKLDAGRVHRYLDTYLGLFDAALATDPGARLDGLLSDSIESGPQNWTDRLRERFAELRGYDPLPWLPALAGYVVGDAARSDRFLFDHRRTIADLVASEYYGTLSAEAHRRGLTYYAEALEDHRPQLGGDLAMRSHADVPMGAMWLFDAGGRPAPTYLADLKGASSVAHVHGKPFTGAESMTAFHRPWSYTPRRLKHVADLELALGVTRFCIHTSPHQPTQVPPPGIALAPQLGQAFVRTEPWAGLAGPWVDYLARCSWLLNQGEPAVDVAVFVGEEAPLTALFGSEPDRTLPPGVDVDYVDLEGLEQRFAVRDGVLVAAGARYRALVLGGSSRRMTVRALRCVAALVDAGAAVVGRRPEGSPSLADDDREHARLCDQLWGTGRVVADDPAAALQGLDVVPRVAVVGAELLRIARRLDGVPVEFLANPDPEPVSVRVRAAGDQDLVAWDPVTRRRTRLLRGGDGDLRLDLPPLGSVFLVPGVAADPPRPAVTAELPLDGHWRVHLPDTADVVLPGDPRPWTELGPAARGFAGVGRYTTEVEVDAALLAAAQAVVLTAVDIGDLARVRVNGTDCGIVWTAPWEVDVTVALRPGTNTVEVEVANAWMNRLIAEAAEPTGTIFAPAAGVYAPDAPLNPAGLLGPVVLGFHAAPLEHDA